MERDLQTGGDEVGDGEPMRNPSPQLEATPGAVLLFDGECALCNGVVRWVLHRDRIGTVCFAPLGSGFGQRQLARLGLPVNDSDSVVFLPDSAGDAFLQRTDGVAAMLRQVGLPHWAGALALIPRGIRDRGYQLAARFRFALLSPVRSPVADDPRWQDRFIAD